MAIDNPQAVRFCNEQIRILADTLLTALRTAEAVREFYYAHPELGDLFYSNSSELVEDGWRNAGSWSNSGLSGEQVIVIPLNGEGRYIKVLMEFDDFVEISQIRVVDAASNVISNGAIYYAEGWR